MTTLETIIRAEDKAKIRDYFMAHEFGRSTECNLISADDATRQITFAFPASGTITHKLCQETFKLTFLECGFSPGDGVYLDQNKGNPVAKFMRAELAGEFINIVLKFPTVEAYMAAKAAGFSHLHIQYQNKHWRIQDKSAVTITAIELTEVGILSKSFPIKAPRQKVRELKDGPIIHIHEIRYTPAAGKLGNVKVDAEKREAVFEFVSSIPFAREDGELVSVAPVCHFGKVLNGPVYPSIKGEPVTGACAVGRITALWWEAEQVYDPEFEAKNNGSKKSLAYGQARIVFDDTPAGNAELAAFIAKGERAVAVELKAIRYTSELVRAEYISTVSAWDLLRISIDGATVIMEPEKPTRTVTGLTEAAPAPAPVKPPGLLKRLFTSPST